MTTPPDQFEQSLLTELRAHVAERSSDRPAAPRQLRRRLVAGAAAAAALAATALVGLTLRPSPAFAVVVQANGDVVVTIDDLRDADGLERALAVEGVEAEVTYDDSIVRPERAAQENGDRSFESEPGSGSSSIPASTSQCDVRVEFADGAVTFRLSAAVVESDSVLHITTAGDIVGIGTVGVWWDGSDTGC